MRLISGEMQLRPNVNDNQRKRQARLATARSNGKHTAAQWQAILAEVKGQCVRCGNFGIKLCKDHIEPICIGGSDAIENIQPLCRSCNSAKSLDVTNWLEYRREHGWSDCPDQAWLPLRKKKPYESTFDAISETNKQIDKQIVGDLS